jgi:UDP-3-O-[3-hydroxymyristoyl] glucosamine N-acyltransferase
MPTLSEIASLLGASVESGRGAMSIRGVAALAEAGPDELSFVGSDEYLRDLDTTRAAAVLVHRRVALPEQVSPTVLLVEDADAALNKVLELFAPPAQRLPCGIAPAAEIDPTATIGEGSAIAAFVSIGPRSRIGQNCCIHAGASVGHDVVIGDDCTIYANAVIRERITIGSRVTIHAGAVIGSDGFGYRWDGEKHVKVPQIGTVIIEDDVEIGSCACIDRARFSATRIGRGTKIDNLVQVAHNCVIGRNCILAGQVGLAGSVNLGESVVLGGQTAVADHVVIAAGVMAAGRSAIVGDIQTKGVVSGMPALPHRQTLREQGAIRRLPEMLNQIRKLEEELEALKARLTGDTGNL